MTDLDELRAALHQQAPDGHAGDVLDAGRIMREGRRIRRVRRARHAAGIVAVAAAVVFVIAGGGWLHSTPPAADRPLATGPPAPDVRPVGEVVSTGIRDSAGERVFYAVRTRDAQLPGVHFGLVAGHRGTDGRLHPQFRVNETNGPDRDPGFHVVDGGEAFEGPYIPVFGYYVGPAETITSTVRGKSVRARQERWSEDPRVVIFWFRPSDVPSQDVLTPPVARDASGARLPG